MTPIDIFFNLDEQLQSIITTYGDAAHGFLALAIFLQIGFVFLPVIPGNSLLFTGGLFATADKGLSLPTLLFIIPIACILGDILNFSLGKFIGGKLIRSGKIKESWINKTRNFYEHHGAKTIIIGRFIPIIRTFAPFVAGMEIMPFRKYIPYSIISAITWSWAFLFAGYFLGGIPWVQANFKYIVPGLFVLITLAIIGGIIKQTLARRKNTQPNP